MHPKIIISMLDKYKQERLYLHVLWDEALDQIQPTKVHLKENLLMLIKRNNCKKELAMIIVPTS